MSFSRIALGNYIRVACFLNRAIPIVIIPLLTHLLSWSFVPGTPVGTWPQHHTVSNGLGPQHLPHSAPSS